MEGPGQGSPRKTERRHSTRQRPSRGPSQQRSPAYRAIAPVGPKLKLLPLQQLAD